MPVTVGKEKFKKTIIIFGLSVFLMIAYIFFSARTGGNITWGTAYVQRTPGKSRMHSRPSSGSKDDPSGSPASGPKREQMSTRPTAVNHGSASLVRLCSMQERRKYVRRMCSLYGDKLPKPRYTAEFLVSDELKLAYCFIPKCASSTMKTLLFASTALGRNETRMPHVHKKATTVLAERGFRIVKYRSKVDMKSFRNYSKILITRNPFERLVSAFNDKFLHPPLFPNFPERLREISGIRPNDTMHFWMFAGALSSKERKFRNRHWERFGTQCHPCTIDYDFILRVETLGRDIELVQSGLNQTWNKNFTKPRNVHAKQSSRNSDNSRVPARLVPEFRDVSDRNTEKLYRQYLYDFRLYGYDFDTDEDMASCSLTTKNDDRCC